MKQARARNGRWSLALPAALVLATGGPGQAEEASACLKSGENVRTMQVIIGKAINEHGLKIRFDAYGNAKWADIGLDDSRARAGDVTLKSNSDALGGSHKIDPSTRSFEVTDTTTCKGIELTLRCGLFSRKPYTRGEQIEHDSDAVEYVDCSVTAF